MDLVIEPMRAEHLVRRERITKLNERWRDTILLEGRSRHFEFNGLRVSVLLWL